VRKSKAGRGLACTRAGRVKARAGREGRQNPHDSEHQASTAKRFSLHPEMAACFKTSGKDDVRLQGWPRQ